jgi:YHS domain-containing protein
MTFLREAMQAVVMIVCEKHATTVLERLNHCPEGNWFVMPPVGACRMGYWPHVSEAHSGQGIALFGFIERSALAQHLKEFAATNPDGSLCTDCVAYEWGITPSHAVETISDPVCGRQVSPAHALSYSYRDELFFFCSIGCRDAFERTPQRYMHQRLTIGPTSRQP